MGSLQDRVDLDLLVNGDGLADNFKNNSLYFYNKYQKSDDVVTSINISDIQMGGFYFLHYMDDSNWMKYSPIFTVEFKKLSNMIVLIGVNFNFIPIEVRVAIFDKFIKEEDFEKNSLLTVDYEGVYTELRKYGFEYAIVEYNVAQIKLVHKITMEVLPRFLYAQHPINKYDPNKLIQIWGAKIDKRDKRHNEIMLATMNDFYDVKKDISSKYDVMKDHIKRIQTSIEKYGGK